MVDKGAWTLDLGGSSERYTFHGFFMNFHGITDVSKKGALFSVQSCGIDIDIPELFVCRMEVTKGDQR